MIRKTATDWQAQLQRDAEFARYALLKQGSLSPMFILHCPGEIRVVGAGWENDSEKRRARQMVGLMALAVNASAISFISEAWSRRVDRRHRETDAEHQARIDAVRPAEAEDRVEVLIVSLTYRDADGRHSFATTMDMVRDASGTLVDVVDRGDLGEGEFGGSMTELLCPVETTPDIRTKAQELIDAFCEANGIALDTEVLRGPLQ